MTDNDKQEDLFRKIRGLLKQAEGNENEHEANAFIQKAQELMLRYQVDEEALWKNDPSRRAKIETITIRIPDKSPGSQHKRIILVSIAGVSNCRMWYKEGKGESFVAGFPVDLVWVEMLYTSVMTQAQFKMALAQAMSTSNPRTFRTNFWIAYADRIAERITETYRKAREAVELESGKSTDLVIVDRKKKVDNWVNENLNLRSARAPSDSGKYDPGARAAGKHAAETTDISGGRRSISKPKGVLNA